ncbi:hypothetical protein BKA61DRAFT_741123 [Leptodontidium sp. MPI-SDFR-AT-0119]|nr:hypothetical protein BKA61DRAFT_741123 [Leptodontidium sp. MPI-SDFR-AT-0119]
MALQATDGVIDPNGLLFRLRQASCTNECSVPQGIQESAVKIYSNGNECEISVAIANNIEAWFYRATPSTGHQWQECWDATEEVINNCIKEGPNKGWWNGVDEYQYYEIGFRALNDPTAKHAPFDSPNTVVSYALPPTPACSGTQPDQLLNVKCKTNDGLQSVRQILYAIRQELCTNGCGGLLVDSSDSSAVFSNGACEIAIGIPNWEVFGYRATYAEGNTQQDCWDGLEEIINECVTGGEVGLEGWVNAARREVFKAGVRRKDDPTALHNKYGFGEPGSISCIL